MKKLKYTLYECGGHVRDELLGLQSNDIDYSVVVEDEFLKEDPTKVFYALATDLKEKGFKIFLETPEMFTIRAKFPDSKEVADFVLSRLETEYIEGTRRPTVTLGTLEDDLRRRDFTVNAMARNKESGEFVDLFGGQKDLQDRILRTPLDASISFEDDPLRILRAIRFSITKEFKLSEEIIDAIKMFKPSGIKKVSVERIRDEFYKMFYHDTISTLTFLKLLEIWNLRFYLLLFRAKNFWLKPSLDGKNNKDKTK
jgi:tRNA nucleotidyltransferase/poly(A) polymerase